MLLSLLLEGSDHADIAKPFTASMTEWIKKTGSVATFVDEKDNVDEPQDWKLGVRIRIRRKGEMRDVLKKLYELAKKHRCEFAVGIVDEATGESEEVCYFGHEEGKPDAFEIANYIGLM